MRKTLTILFLLCVLVPSSTVNAQGIPPSVIDTTMPVDGDVRAAVDAWLTASAPVSYPYWVITYAGKKDETGDVFVSLSALDLQSLTDKWHLTDDNLVKWMGSVIVHINGTVDVYSDGGYNADMGRKSAKIAAPKLAGGGRNVRFPWQDGMSMMYGTRGIHAAGGGAAYANGFSAVDFVGGTDLGSGVANNKVFAVATGAVDYVCQDPTTTLIRTANTETGDYYIYAHLLENATLTEGYTFSQGATIGTLKYGSFDDNCGGAKQTPHHYHLHFGFKPANGYFIMRSCTLSMSSQKWTCGWNTMTTEVAPGGFLRNQGGGSDINTDDGGLLTAQLSFWDYMLIGATSMWSQFVTANMPDHTTNTFLYALYNGISVTIRVVRVMVYSNINLAHFFVVLLFGMAIKTILGIAEFIVFLFKAWKSLVPVLGA